MNTQYFTTNNNQKFPLSTEALAFMQEQIKLAYGLTDLAGANIIVREPTASKNGLVIYDGELLPLTGTPPTTTAAARQTAITIAEHTETMSVEGKFEGNIRTTRVASYVSTRIVRPQRVGGTGQQQKMLSAFTKLKNISTLMAELDEAKKHVMPKGSIIAWSGTCDCDHVPYGFIPCGGFFGGSSNRFSPDGDGTKEKAKWEAKYAGLNISVTIRAVNNGSVAGVRIASCNGVTIPDLTDRFIVQAGMSYQEGSTGGANTVTLTVNQIPSHNHGGITNNGTPDGAHKHKGAYKDYQNSGRDYGWPYISQSNDNGTHDVPWGDGESGKHTHTIPAQGGGQAHENRPPYYALCYLIKVI